MEINDIIPEQDWNEYVIQDAPTPPTTKNIVSSFFLNGMANAVKGLLTQVADIAYNAGLIADYVEDYGSNSNGNWVKYKSGKLFQYGYAAITTSNKLINFPVDFMNTTYNPFSQLDSVQAFDRSVSLHRTNKSYMTVHIFNAPASVGVHWQTWGKWK